MTDRELDAMMRRILLDTTRLEWSKDLEWKSAFMPSAKYNREIKAMLADPLTWERKKTFPVWKRAARWTAVVLLVISLGLSGLIAASPTVRAAFARWITEWYETHVTYRYTGTNMIGAMPRYEIPELPEGYVEVESERVDCPVRLISFTVAMIPGKQYI